MRKHWRLCKKALPLRPKQLDKAITTLFIGRIYFEIGQYEEAQKYYSETKRDYSDVRKSSYEAIMDR